MKVACFYEVQTLSGYTSECTPVYIRPVIKCLYKLIMQKADYPEWNRMCVQSNSVVASLFCL